MDFPRLAFMKTKISELMAALLMGVELWAAEVSDVTPPRLVAFDMSTNIVDASTTNQTIELTARFTDDLSGMLMPGPFGSSAIAVAAQFQNFNGYRDVPPLSTTFIRESGDTLDLICKGILIVPQYAATGTWSLVSLQVSDNARNTGRFLSSDLQSLGAPITFTVKGIEDRTAPELVSLSFSTTNTVNTSDSGQTITLTARMRDELSGLRGGGTDAQGRPNPNGPFVTFYSPSRTQSAQARLFDIVSGDEHDAVVTGTIFLPRYSESGTWRFESAFLSDAIRNTRMTDLGAALAQGFATEFTVTGQGDTNAPQVRALDFFPRRIDASLSSQVVTFTIRTMDDLSGFSDSSASIHASGAASATFVSPSKKQSASVSVDFFNVVGGAPPELDTVKTNSLFLPQYSETGVWTLAGLAVRDVTGNTTALESRDLRRLGFPTELAVGIAPPLTITRQDDLLLLSWPSWGSAFRLESGALNGPSDWEAVAGHPALIGENLILAVPASNGPRFFQLVETQ